MTAGSWESMMQAEDLPLPATDSNAGRLTDQALRLTVRREEAASMLGIGIDSLDAHVLPEIRTVRLNRMILVPVQELRRWIELHAGRVGADW